MIYIIILWCLYTILILIFFSSVRNDGKIWDALLSQFEHVASLLVAVCAYRFNASPVSVARAGFSLVRHYHRHSAARSRPSGHCVAIALICDRHVYVYITPRATTAAATTTDRSRNILSRFNKSQYAQTQSSSWSSSLSRNYRGPVARWVWRACCTGSLLAVIL